MNVVAWNNGKHQTSGTGYGIRLAAEERDRFFDRRDEFITMRIEGRPDSFRVNTKKKTFWNEKCRELIHREIGVWLRNSGLAPWIRGAPPSLILRKLKDGTFRLSNH